MVKIISRGLLTISLLAGLAGKTYSMARPPSKPVPMEFVRAVYEEEAKTIVIEWVVPDIDKVDDLGRIELLFSQPASVPVFGVILNCGDLCDPIPPGDFGVIRNPESNDRSIKNISSAAGLPARWDHPSPKGTLLKESTRDIINGNMGISLWLVPKDWTPGRYEIKVRLVQRKHMPPPWQKLATLDYTGKEAEETEQNQCRVSPVFFNPGSDQAMSVDDVGTVTLIRYEKQPQDEGIVVKRWAGDTSGEYKYVEIEKRTLTPDQFTDGMLSLEPGFYQLQHNSVSGQPSSGYYGKSDLFEIKPGQKNIEVNVPLFPAI